MHKERLRFLLKKSFWHIPNRVIYHKQNEFFVSLSSKSSAAAPWLPHSCKVSHLFGSVTGRREPSYRKCLCVSVLSHHSKKKQSQSEVKSQWELTPFLRSPASCVAPEIGYIGRRESREERKIGKIKSLFWSLIIGVFNGPSLANRSRRCNDKIASRWSGWRGWRFKGVSHRSSFTCVHKCIEEDDKCMCGLWLK